MTEMDTSEEENRDSSPRKYSVLSPEEKSSIFKDFRLWLQQGCCDRKIDDSLLGLDWSLFDIRELPDSYDQVNRWTPPEFKSFAYSTLDAYVAAVLASHASPGTMGVLCFTCSLKPGDVDMGMLLEFVTKAEKGGLDSESLTIRMLESFPEFLEARGLKPGTVLFLEGEGCPMSLKYPGQMLAHVSPFLRDRPADLWPQITLRLVPTVELVERARTVLAFRRESFTDSPLN